MSEAVDLSGLPARFQDMREPFSIRESRLIRRALAVAWAALSDQEAHAMDIRDRERGGVAMFTIKEMGHE